MFFGYWSNERTWEKFDISWRCLDIDYTDNDYAVIIRISVLSLNEKFLVNEERVIDWFIHWF